MYSFFFCLISLPRSVFNVKVILEFFGDFSSSNFGVVLVVCSNEKLVTAKEALASGPQPRPKMETIIITLMHLALQSESVELEVFILFAGPCSETVETSGATSIGLLGSYAL